MKYMDAIVLKFRTRRPSDPPSRLTPRAHRPRRLHRRDQGRPGRALGGAASLSPPEALPRPAHPEGAELVNRLLAAAEGSASAEPLTHISRIAGGRYFEHVGQGSWKAWRAAASRRRRGLSRALHLQLDPHELRLALFVATLVLVAGAAAAPASPRAAAKAPRRRRGGQHARTEGEANLERLAVLRRALRVSGCRAAQRAARRGAPLPQPMAHRRLLARALGLGRAPPLDSATRTRLRRFGSSPWWDVAAPSTALAFGGVIDAVEFGALFSAIVHLLTLPPHEPRRASPPPTLDASATIPAGAPRVGLRPRVTLHPVAPRRRRAAVTAAPASALGAAAAGAAGGRRDVGGGGGVRALSKSVGYVLVLDAGCPTPSRRPPSARRSGGRRGGTSCTPTR